MAQPESDASVLEGCRDGDPHAQREVFERYKDRVFSVALNFLKGDHAGAEDVTQEVFVKVFRAAPTFRNDSRVSTWIYRITANACMDELRRRKRLLLFGDVPAHADRPVQPVEPISLDRRVSSALGRLSPKLRMVVLLRHFDDLSYDEIAEAMGITPGTVASRLNRAHRRLADDLRGTEAEGGPAR